MKYVSKGILVGMAIFSAQAFSESLSFRASDFVMGGAASLPETFDHIDCEFDYTVTANSELELNSFELTMGDKLFDLDDVGVRLSTSSNRLIGGLASGESTIMFGTDDFYFYVNIETNTVSNFSFATSEIPSSFYRVNTIEYNVNDASIAVVLDEDEGFYVPSDGGRVDYDVSLENFVPGEILSQWSVLTMPNGDEFPIHKLRERQVTGWDGTVNYNRNHLNIPEWFDDGEYTLTWYLANTETLERNKGSMTFEKGEEALRVKQAMKSFHDAVDVEFKLHDNEVLETVGKGQKGQKGQNGEKGEQGGTSRITLK